MCSNGILASAPIVNENKVVMMVPSTGGANVDNAGEYVFRIGNSDLLVGRDIASKMVQLGYKKVGVIAESTEYTSDIKTSFTQKAQELGLNVALSESFGPNTTDFRTLSTKIKAANLDGILIASQTGISGGMLIKQIKTLGIKTAIFSDFLLVFNTDVQKIVGSLDGVYYADPSVAQNNPTADAFFKNYEVVYKIKPIAPYFAAGTYDIIQIFSSAIKVNDDDSVVAHDWILKNVQNYQGFIGTFSLDAAGNANTGYTIKILKNGQSVLVK